MPGACATPSCSTLPLMLLLVLVLLLRHAPSPHAALYPVPDPTWLRLLAASLAPASPSHTLHPTTDTPRPRVQRAPGVCGGGCAAGSVQGGGARGCGLPGGGGGGRGGGTRHRCPHAAHQVEGEEGPVEVEGGLPQSRRRVMQYCAACGGQQLVWRLGAVESRRGAHRQRDGHQQESMAARGRKQMVHLSQHVCPGTLNRPLPYLTPSCPCVCCVCGPPPLPFGIHQQTPTLYSLAPACGCDASPPRHTHTQPPGL